MFKGAVGTKERAKPDVFTGVMSGKQIKRSQLEDPHRPGHLPEGLLLDPEQWSAAQHFGLRSPSGRSIQFISPSRDPRDPRREEAPENLLQKAAEAQAVIDAHEEKMNAVFDKLIAAGKERMAVSAQLASVWPPPDDRVYTVAYGKEEELRRQHRRLMEQNTGLHHDRGDAERDIARWMADERVRRHSLT